MTVKLYSGTPGSGKSLHVTQMILLALWSGRDVISNYPVKFNKREKKKGYEQRFFYVPEERITVSNLMQFALLRGYMSKRKESQCLVIIDEAGGRFNCREYGKSDRQQWCKFFSQHRKYGYDITLVAQNDRMLDRQIRAMLEIEYKHRKAQNMYWWFRLFPLKIFVSVEYYYGTRMKTGVEFFTYRKSIGNRYDTFKLFDEMELPTFREDIENADIRSVFKGA